MKTIKELVKIYVNQVIILEDMEQSRSEYDVLEFCGEFDKTVTLLKIAIEDEYDVEFTELCNCKAQQILNGLCDIEFNTKNTEL
tara:strand:+ start:578 stop:829 length:252 start_codon:yes stop_codon:yes gene_type:complete